MQIFEHSDVIIVIKGRVGYGLKWAKVFESTVKKSFGKKITLALVYFVSWDVAN